MNRRSGAIVATSLLLVGSLGAERGGQRRAHDGAADHDGPRRLPQRGARHLAGALPQPGRPGRLGGRAGTSPGPAS